MEKEKNKKSFWFLNPIALVILLFIAAAGLLLGDIYKQSKTPIPIVLKTNDNLTEEIENEPNESYTAKPSTVNTTALNPVKDDLVAFNPNSHKYHKPYCEWAKKCKRCIKIPKSQALEQGGIPCKVCGR